jgi:carbon-monoxide dehydrogenase medium subunit
LKEKCSMHGFDYQRPSSFEEACRLMGQSGGRSRVLAGGTDLLVRIKRGRVRPEALISLREVSELSGISFLPDRGATIGAMTTIETLESSKEILESFKAVAEAAGQIGSAQVRSRATIGGNLCNAERVADLAPSLIAYGAAASVSDGTNERTIPLEDFFAGPGETVLGVGELVRAIHVPTPPQPSFGTYLKASRPSFSPAMAGLGVVAVFAPDGESLSELRLVVGAAAPVPFRTRKAEELASGNKLEDGLIDEVSRTASDEAQPVSDLRCTEGYRRELIRAMVRRALVAARAWAQRGDQP